jgi:hypothetical protein
MVQHAALAGQRHRTEPYQAAPDVAVHERPPAPGHRPPPEDVRPEKSPPVALELIDGLTRRNREGVTVEEQELNDFALRELRRLARETQSPLHRTETRLSPVVAFLIAPVFAFANAGLTVPTGKL